MGWAAPRVVLVHGAHADASVWDEVVAGLRGLGLQAEAVTLPGRGGDGLAKASVTLASQREAVLQAVRACDGPALLVGHGAGGMVVSSAAEAAPDHVAALVYLAALVPRDGDSQASLAARDADRSAAGAMRIDTRHRVSFVSHRHRGALYAQDGTAAQQIRFAEAMVDEPLGPAQTPVALTAARFGRVRKVYIRTRRDLVISPWLQQAMIRESGIDETATVDSGHAPFLTRPADVVRLIAAAVWL